MPSGTAFIKHEFDEAIAIQQSIVESGSALSTSHPVAAVKRQLRSDLKVDRQHLTKLQQLGKPYGAAGKREDVAKALGSSSPSETAKRPEPTRAMPTRRMPCC